MKSFDVYLSIKGVIKKRIQAPNSDEAKKIADKMWWRLVEEQNSSIGKNITLHEDRSKTIGTMEIIS